MFPLRSVAQETKIRLSGVILNEANVGIYNSTVKITTKDGIILAYFNTGEKNNFSVQIPLSTTDSINIEVSHVSYNSVKKNGTAANLNSSQLTYILHQKIKSLETVEVKAPPTWVRGDTTFHKVSAYQEGDEKKLQDILLKMPDFSLDNDGKVLYKKQPIEKITIDNESLFSDKTELLMKNLPVHVLNTVQAIENQSSQKLLKGLDGEKKVFLNLELKKGSRMSAAFGDGEAGIGNRSRYNISPVLFSMYGKTKFGLIGNYNSIGNGIGFQQERELRSEKETNAASLLMRGYSLHLINNFENRWYIKNNQWDTRIQINNPLSKKVSSSTEINYIRDRQKQNTYFKSSIYDGEKYQDRLDTNNNLNVPKIWAFRQTFEINPDSNKQLILKANLMLDKSNGYRYSIFRGFEINSPLERNTENNWSSMDISATYTVRKNPNFAHTFSLSANGQNLNQDAVNNSNDFGKIFNLVKPGNKLNVGLNSNYNALDAKWSLLRRGKLGNIINIGLTGSYLKTKLSNYAILSNSEEFLLAPDSLNNHSDYTYSSININIRRSEKIFFKEPLIIKADVGFLRTTIKESSRFSTLNNFVMNTSLTQQFKLWDLLNSRMNVSYVRAPLRTLEILGSYYPSTNISFYRNNQINEGQQKAHFDYSVSWRWPESLSETSVYFGYDYRLNNRLPIYNYSYFLQFTTDSLVQQGTRLLSLSISNQIPSVLINALLNFGINYSRSNALVNSPQGIQTSDFALVAFHFSLKKNWNKRFFLRAQSFYSLNIYNIPNAISSNTTNKISSLRTNLYNRFVVNKQLYLVLNANVFHNNLFTINKSVTLLTDIEMNYTLKQRPFSFSVKAENLGNERYLNIFSNSIVSQSFISVPLIGRSIYASVRYNF